MHVWQKTEHVHIVRNLDTGRFAMIFGPSRNSNPAIGNSRDFDFMRGRLVSKDQTDAGQHAGYAPSFQVELESAVQQQANTDNPQGSGKGVCSLPIQC